MLFGGCMVINDGQMIENVWRLDISLRLTFVFWGVLALTDSSVRLYAPELRKPKSEYKVRLPW